MKQLSKIYIVFTKKLSKIVDINPLYLNNIKTLLISDNFNNIPKIDIKKMPQLTFLKVCEKAVELTYKNTNLLSLELVDIGNNFDLSCINNFPNLKNLILMNGEIQDFDKFDQSNCLEELTIDNLTITSCSGLNKLYFLKKLSIRSKFNSDITAKLSNLIHLEYLELDYFTEIDNVEWVKGLHNLKIIILGCVVHNGDLSPLTNLQHVRLKVECSNYNFHDSDLPKCYNYLITDSAQ